ncbi:hypothetical protein ACJMK2_031214 [Sinanodonta woodiana]|uniref:Mitochondria-eating protein C-terminal domain-containing protein n=1 Tax=Sinanodonta woodiana TaxID=1069815 RepID=A0ABD3WY45_SINWO
MKELNSKKYNNINMERIRKAKKELDVIAGVGLVNKNDLDTIKNLLDLLAEFFQNTSNRTSRDKMEIFLKYSNEALQEIKKGMRLEREKDQLPDSTSSSDSSRVSHTHVKSSERLVHSDGDVSKKVAASVRSDRQKASHSAKPNTISRVSHASLGNTTVTINKLQSDLRTNSSMEPNLVKFNKNPPPDPKKKLSSPKFFEVLKRNLGHEKSEETEDTKVPHNKRKRKKLVDQTRHPILYEENSKERIDEQLEEEHVSENGFKKNEKSTILTLVDHEPDKHNNTISHDEETKKDTSVNNEFSNLIADIQNEMKSSNGQESKHLKFGLNPKTEDNSSNTRERDKRSSESSHIKEPYENTLRQVNRVLFLSDEEKTNGKTSFQKDSSRATMSARRTRQKHQSSKSRGQTTVEYVNVQEDTALSSMNKAKSSMPNQTAREVMISVGTQSDGTGIAQEQTFTKRSRSSTGLEEVTEGTEHLRLEIRILKKENEELRGSKEELLTRLSQKASEALRNGNERITNLNDNNRPTKLAERFSELYENEWTDSYEEISATAGKEEDIISTLLRILMFAYQFCDKCAKGQMTNIETFVRKEILFPNGSKDDVGIEQFGTVDLDEISYPLKELRKQFGPVSLHKMKQMIIRQIGKSIVTSVNESKKLYLYTERCVELTWLMCIQDPPMYLYLGQARTPHNDIFKPYRKSGKIVEYFVWPCLYLHEGGPLMSKGVAQMIDS